MYNHVGFLVVVTFSCLRQTNCLEPWATSRSNHGRQETGVEPSDFRNISIIFMGDSIVRYQYLALAAFIHHGAWPNSTADFDSPDLQYEPDVSSIFAVNSSVEARYHDTYSRRYEHYYNFTNAYFGGDEICDCRRHSKTSTLLTPWSVENRFYTNSRLNVSLVFIQFFGDTPRSGTYPVTWYDKASFTNTALFLRTNWPCTHFLFSPGHHKLTWSNMQWNNFGRLVHEHFTSQGCTPIFQTLTPVRQWRNTKSGRYYHPFVSNLPLSLRDGAKGLVLANKKIRKMDNKIYFTLRNGWMLFDALSN